MATQVKTFVYKKVDDIELRVDVHVPRTASAAPFPVLFWIHGGGCVQGRRQAVAPHLRRAVDHHNIVVISPDYRLAPQARLPTILGDVGDAYLWAINSLPELLPGALDTTRVAVSGSSVGGYLASWLSLGKTPSVPLGVPELRRIKGLGLIYPITTFNSTFWSEPREPYGGYLSPDISRDARWATFLDPAAPTVSNTDSQEWEALPVKYREERGKGGDPLRNWFYSYAQQFAPDHGLDRQNFSPEQIAQGLLDEYDVSRWITSEHERIRAEGLTTQLFIVHGDADKAVDVAQGRGLAKVASSLGWTVQYEERTGADQYVRFPQAYVRRYANHYGTLLTRSRSSQFDGTSGSGSEELRLIL